MRAVSGNLFSTDRAILLLSAGDNDLAACACDLATWGGAVCCFETHPLDSRVASGGDLPFAIGGKHCLLRRHLQIFQIVISLLITQRRITRIADLARQLFMNQRDRRFFRAHKRGELRAVQYLANHSQPQQVQKCFARRGPLV